MANYDKDRDAFRDPYGPVDPVDPPARMSTGDPAIDPRTRSHVPGEPRPGRSGASVLVPILLLALLVAGAWWLMTATPDQHGAETTMGAGYETAPAGPEAGVPGVVGREADTVGTAGRGDGLIGVQAGEDVHLHDARITDLAGERTFWIEAGAGERMLVIAPHTTGVSGQIGDRREGFRAGQTVAIEGRVEQAGETMVDGLSEADRQAVQSADGLVLRAIRVTGL